MMRIIAVDLLAQGGVLRLKRTALALGRLGRGFGLDVYKRQLIYCIIDHQPEIYKQVCKNL